MPVLASDIATLARGIISDGVADNFSRDDLTAQSDGSNKRFTLVNRNLVATPSVVLVGGVSVTPASVDLVGGSMTLTVAPTEGQQVLVEYNFFLVSDASMQGFVTQAALWCGAPNDFTWPSGVVKLPDPGLLNAAGLYAGFLSAKKLASGTTWYYSGGSGGKSFNKDSISAKWKALADELKADAETARVDPYSRYARRNIPSTSLGNMGGFGNWTPPR